MYGRAAGSLYVYSCPLTKYGPGHERPINDTKLILCSIRTADVCHFKNTRFVLALKPLTHNFSFASRIIPVAKRGNGLISTVTSYLSS